MSSSSGTDFLSFPVGVLGVVPVRIPILARGADWLALAKPPGLAIGPDAFAPEASDLLAAIRAAIAAGKRQLLEQGVTRAGRVHPVDTAASGVVVLALTAEAEARLRNAVGSRQWEFVYDLVTEVSPDLPAGALTCDLPVAAHREQPRAIVSHTTGKRSATTFAPVQSLGRWALWEARTRENRPHQVRLHAHEVGLRIPGDAVYGRVPRVYLSRLKRNYRAGSREERPLHPHLALHLRAIEGCDGAGHRIIAPRPRTFTLLLRRLAAAAGLSHAP